MRKTYIKPRTEAVPQTYYEGLMQTLSLGTGTGGATAPPDAKPDLWGDDPSNDAWGDPNTNW